MSAVTSTPVCKTCFSSSRGPRLASAPIARQRKASTSARRPHHPAAAFTAYARAFARTLSNAYGIDPDMVVAALRRDLREPADEPALRVTTIYPGRIDTDMQRDLVAYEGGEYRPERFLRPETVARFVAEAINAPADADVHEVVVRPRSR